MNEFYYVLYVLMCLLNDLTTTSRLNSFVIIPSRPQWKAERVPVSSSTTTADAYSYGFWLVMCLFLKRKQHFYIQMRPLVCMHERKCEKCVFITTSCKKMIVLPHANSLFVLPNSSGCAVISCIYLLSCMAHSKKCPYV